MGRTAWFDGKGMKKGEWTAEEDRKLTVYINKHGLGDWRVLPRKAGLQRCGKSCRLRWLNYLRPGIKRGKFTPQEEEEVIKSHASLGNRWAAIARQMPNRTDNDIKNHWNSCLKKRLARNGIDPVTHEPILSVKVTPSSTPSTSSSFSPSSSSASSRLLNMLASGQHGIDKVTIKDLILSEPNSSSNNGEAALEEKIMCKEQQEEEEEACGCFMEIDENLISTTTSFDEFPSLVDPYGLYQSDFLETDVQLDMFLL